MAEIKQMRFAEGKESSYVPDIKITLAPDLVAQIVNYANACCKIYPKMAPEATKIFNQFQVPTNICRVDCSVVDPSIQKLEGNYQISGKNVFNIENEENPRGRAFTSMINQQFEESFGSLHRPGIDNIAVVSDQRKLRHNFDDGLIPNYLVDINKARKMLLENPDLYINPIDISTNRLADQFPDLVSSFGSTSKTEGNKLYQVESGQAFLGNDIDDANQQFLLETGFVSQPFKDTSKTRGIALYLPKNKTVNPDDHKYLINTQQEALKFLKRKSVIIKPYCPPIEINPIVQSENLPSLQDYVGIIRFYLLFNQTTKIFIPAGGTLMARPKSSVVIHGTPDSVAFPVIIS